MPVKDRPDLGQHATIPVDTTQSVRFGSISELVKDAWVTELAEFFNTKYTSMRIGTSGEPFEYPRVEKYQTKLDVSTDPLETAVGLIRSYPDVVEDLPLIAVLTATGQNLKLGISGKDIRTVIPAAKVVSSSTGPFVLAEGYTLILKTTPNGTSEEFTSTYTFRSYMFSSIGAATVDEVIRAINAQALYAIAYKTYTGNLALRAGHYGMGFPNIITITGGTARAALGFTLNQTDQNFGAGKQAMERHCVSATISLGLEVVAESENVRTELTDLLYSFITLVMADRQFQFYGRSVFDESVADEYYQIIIKDSEVQLSGEQETPRLNDPKDKLYINRITVPCLVFQYTDRIITDSKGNIATPVRGLVMQEDSTLPEPN